MRYEQTTLEAIRFRARATQEKFMTIDVLARDLGAPADFWDVLENLHARGLITLHRDSQAVRLTERGEREDAAPATMSAFDRLMWSLRKIPGPRAH